MAFCTSNWWATCATHCGTDNSHMCSQLKLIFINVVILCLMLTLVNHFAH
jgi:hypothetical protein